jgi:hypothetical protein
LHEGAFNRLRDIRRNIIPPNVLADNQLIHPTPRNTLMVQVSKGKGIAALEEATQKACRGCPIRAR